MTQDSEVPWERTTRHDKDERTKARVLTTFDSESQYVMKPRADQQFLTSLRKATLLEDEKEIISPRMDPMSAKNAEGSLFKNFFINTFEQIRKLSMNQNHVDTEDESHNLPNESQKSMKQNTTVVRMYSLSRDETLSMGMCSMSLRIKDS